MRSGHQARARAPALATVYAVGAAMVLVGAARTAYVHAYAEHAGGDAPEPAAEPRYGAIESLLGEARIVGFVAEEGDPNPLRRRAPARRDPALLYVKAAYALAPRVLVPHADRTEYVLADFTSEAALSALLERHRLEPVVVVGDGLALLRRRR